MAPDSLETPRSALADRYTVVREIGRGGMATVYLAQDLKQPLPPRRRTLTARRTPRPLSCLRQFGLFVVEAGDGDAWRGHPRDGSVPRW
jgi:serine/threonine protein kinase